MLKLIGSITFRGTRQDVFVGPQICNSEDRLVVIIGNDGDGKRTKMMVSTDGYRYWLDFRYRYASKTWDKILLFRDNNIDYIEDMPKRRNRYLTVEEEEQIKAFILEQAIPSVEKEKFSATHP